MRANVGAGLKEVQEALDLCRLRSLDWLDYAKPWALSGSGFPLEQELIVKHEDVTDWIWQSVWHVRLTVERLFGSGDLLFWVD